MAYSVRITQNAEQDLSEIISYFIEKLAIFLAPGNGAAAKAVSTAEAEQKSPAKSRAFLFEGYRTAELPTPLGVVPNIKKK